MVYNRKIYPRLLAHTRSAFVTVLTGMRRTGKTTLIKKLIEELPNKNSLYLDLQRPDNRELFLMKNYDRILEAFWARGLSRNHQAIVFLDEIQLAPDVPGAIKYLVDHHQVKFVVTGSSSYYLKNLFSESLSGRKQIFELYPLDFGEFLTFKNIPYAENNWQDRPFNQAEYNRLSAYYDEFIRFGGFPQVVLEPESANKKEILLDIMSSYVNIDVRSLADFADERNLYALTKLLAGRVGSRIENTTLSRLTGIPRLTVANYLAFLEKTYLIRTVPVYTKNPGREIVKSRKLYFCDTGLANTLTALSDGAQFENTLFNQLQGLGTVQYYALKTGREIDFIFEGKLALEAKETPTVKDLLYLNNLTQTAGLTRCRLVGRWQTPKFDDYIWGGSVI